MADISLKTSVSSSQTGINTQSLGVEECFEQATLPLAANMDAGTPVYINSSGKFAKCDASAAETAKFYGIIVKKGKSGEYRTAIARGVVSGFDFTSQSYGADIYLSDTEGKLADATGTVTKKVGEVIPAYNEPLGSSPAKLLRITG